MNDYHLSGFMNILLDVISFYKNLNCYLASLEVSGFTVLSFMAHVGSSRYLSVLWAVEKSL